MKTVDDCIEAAISGRRERWVILSRGERRSGPEAMNEGIKRHASAYKLGFEAQEYDWKGDEGSYRALEVTLPQGSKITALPANPDTARGFSANVFLDEFAFHKDSGAIWKALFQSSRQATSCASRPPPERQVRQILRARHRLGWRLSRHVVDIYKAVADGLRRDIKELREGIADEDAWARNTTQVPG